jgi:fatty-acyl-CoA synthase
MKIPLTLGAFLAERAALRGATAALIDRDRPISWQALQAEAQRVAAGLARVGIGAGDRVAIWLPNVPAWLATYFACGQLGAIALSVNTRFRTHEIQDILGRSGARALVFWPGFRGIDFTGILAQCAPASLAKLEHVIAYGEHETIPTHLVGRTLRTYAELSMAEPLAEDRGAPSTGVVIFTTSGTTKAPKFVLHSHATVLAHAVDVARGFGYLEPQTRVLVTAPLCGVFGFCNAMGALAAAQPLVMLPTFEARAAAAAIQRHHVTHTHATDEMIVQMLEATPQAVPFPSARYFGFAAFSPALADLPARARERGLDLVGLYGSSEVQALYALQPLGAPATERWMAGGKPVSVTAAVRATDPETRAVVAHGTPGELEFKGPSVMVGYFGNDAATREALSADGFFRSGDLGYTLEDGRFVFLHRLGDAMRLSGFLVSPLEIEDVLHEHASVEAAQVVGAVTKAGVKPVAFVIMRPDSRFDERALIEHCASKMARFKVPARIQPVDAFPVTASANASKIQKAKLREMAEALLASVD